MWCLSFGCTPFSSPPDPVTVGDPTCHSRDLLYSVEISPGLSRNAIFVIGLLLWITRSPLRVIGRGPGPTSTLSAHWLPLAARNRTFPPEMLEMQLTRQDMRRATWKPFPRGPVSSSRPLKCVPTASQPDQVPRKRDVCKLTRVTRFFCSKHG